MDKNQLKVSKRQRRHQRIRTRVKGLPARPRLCVFRSSAHIYAQIIDDSAGHTLLSCSSNDPAFQSGELAKGSTVAGAQRVGELIAVRAIEQGIQNVVFDRAGYQYHGRIKALADGARSKGLVF